MPVDQDKQGKQSQGKKKTTPSAKTQPKKEIGRDKPQDAKDKRIELLERENMMLRKKLDIKEIIEEFRKQGCQGIDMNGIIQESLYDLQLRLQQCRCGENGTESEADTEKKLPKAQDDLRIAKQKLEYAKSDLEAKNKLITELEMQLKRQSSGRKTDGSESDTSIVKKLTEENRDLDEKLNETNKKLEEGRNRVTLIEKELNSTRAKYEIIQNIRERNDSGLCASGRLTTMDHSSEMSKTMDDGGQYVSGMLENIGRSSEMSKTRYLKESDDETSRFRSSNKRLEDRLEKLLLEREEKYKKDTENLQHEVEKLKMAVEDLKKSSEKNASSQVDGAKIRVNEPDIADISDENRPTKLAGKYSELYDHEWTDAFEEAENYGAEERQTIGVLYTQLVEAYNFCQHVAEKHPWNIQNNEMNLPTDTNGAQMPETSVANIAQLKAPCFVDDVVQLFVKEKNFTGKPKMERFARECCKLCWLMSSQDPPVVLDTTEAKGIFDGDKFRAYTKTGKTIDYVVWPALLLYKGGPLLGKGVAQGK